MQIDFDNIRNDNIHNRGQKTDHLAFLGDLYKNRTQFVFELLQNAEDANASKIRFDLHPDKLEVQHNGRLFTEQDVIGLSDIGRSTKKDDTTQIGRFGIGFKSVYAYTSTPEIHTAAVCFRVEHYVRPFEIPDATPQFDDGNTTLFVLPFNHAELSPETAYEEIAQCLRTLSVHTLLFLRNLEEIEYQISENATTTARGTYLRETKQLENAREVTVIGQNEQAEESETWLLFERPTNKTHVELGFKVENDQIVRAEQTPLAVYFPTSKETPFGFCIQGPYHTTPARDNVKENDAWNKQLICETAELIKSAMRAIKQQGLLTVSFLEAIMPRDRGDEMFEPIAASIEQAFLHEELLPTELGEFVAARNARLARGKELVDLLTSAQLTQLYGTSDTLHWLPTKITENKTRLLFEYLTKQLSVKEIEAKDFAGLLDEGFLNNQPDQWFIEFYEYLDPLKALWGKGKPLRTKPILRLEDGNLLSPYKKIDDAHPCTYLPPDGDTNFPIVKRTIAQDDKARSFLEALGLKEPNICDEVVERILPKYDGMKEILDEEHRRDLAMIDKALCGDPSGQQKVKAGAQNARLLRAVDLTGDERFKTPHEVYHDTDALRQYFVEGVDVWFLHKDYYDAYEIGDGLWQKLDISHLPRKYRTDEASPLRQVPARAPHGIKISNYDMHGLAEFLNAMQDASDREKLSDLLWEFLRQHRQENRCFFEGLQKWFYHVERSEGFPSTILDRLKTNPWLPAADGTLVKPKEIAVDELPEPYRDAVALIDELEIKPNSIHQQELEAAETLKISVEDVQFIADHRKEYDEFKATVAKPEFPSNPVNDPVRRTMKIKTLAAKASIKTYEKRERSVRTSEMDEIKTMLRSQYTNDDNQMICQLCHQEMPFRQPNDLHYFEKRELLLDFSLKEESAKYIALCPVCAAKYDVFIKRGDDFHSQLKEAISEPDSNKDTFPIQLGPESVELRFVETHIFDLRLLIAES